jgi:hypothetical protein
VIIPKNLNSTDAPVFFGKARILHKEQRGQSVRGMTIEDMILGSIE